MKSAYELAMERMGEEDKPVSDEKKAKIAEIDSKYKAKIAERKIFLQKNLSDARASGNEEEIDLLRRQLNDEIADLEAKSEAEKDRVRNHWFINIIISRNWSFRALKMIGFHNELPENLHLFHFAVQNGW